MALKPDLRQETDIEALLQWAVGAELADRYIEALDGPDAYRGGVSADGCFSVERYARLGTFVDCTGSGGDAVARCHEDAETVVRLAKDTMDAGTYVLVISCARQRTRPDWNPFPVVKFEPEWVRRNKGKGIKPRVRRLPNGAEFCPVTLSDKAVSIEGAREFYLWWWEAMNGLARDLRRVDLSRWTVVPWYVPREPWRKFS